MESVPVINFQFVEWSNIKKTYQINSNVIPAVGSKYSIASSIDENGDYRKAKDDITHMGDVQPVLEGIVQKVEYFFEETGDCSQRYHSQLYVKVILSPC